jgi:hypothetical protein
MKIKQFISAVMILLLGTTVLASCGKGSGSQFQAAQAANFNLDKLPIAGNWGGYEWVVLEKVANRSLCITKDIIEIRKFNETEAAVSWEESDLRAYLNGEFYDKMFDGNVSVLLVRNNNSDVIFSNGKVGIGSAETDDRVFLLSYNEAKMYFPNDTYRIATYNGQPQYWWLRSPGDYLTDFANVDTIGQVCYSQSNVHTSGLGVRPVICVALPE